MPRQWCAVSSHQAHPGLVVLVAVLDVLPSASAGCIVPVTFAVYVAVAVSAAITVAADDVFFPLALLVDCCLCPPPLLSPLLSSLPPTAFALANYQGLQLDQSK
jgi:hypothetical protein